ncbi:MAG: DUF2079 domain-containing protein, partial [Nakamurella sp.]
MTMMGRSGAARTMRLIRSGAGVPWFFAAVLTVGYSGLSLRRQFLLQTSGYDMGIFVQSARSWSQFHWPVSTLKGPGYPLLGNHFSPIVALVGPFYRLFPSANTLLVIQAILLAAGVVPLM